MGSLCRSVHENHFLYPLFEIFENLESNLRIAEEQALPPVLRICRLRVASPKTRELLVSPAALDFVTQAEATATMAKLKREIFRIDNQKSGSSTKETGTTLMPILLSVSRAEQHKIRSRSI